MIWFTSDTHWGHRNIINFCDRPWQSVEEMDEALILRWNTLVKPDDTIWHLGDITFYRDPEKIRSILSRLMGHKHLILGNHDVELIHDRPRCGEAILENFETVQNKTEIRIHGIRTTLDHFPAFSWNKCHKSAFMLHGHEHGNIDKINLSCRRLDVGVDSHEWYPISEDQVYNLLIDRPLTEHHNNKAT